MAAHNELGRLGEMEAIRYLVSKDYHILAHNWCVGRLELDIVAEKLGHLVVVEVKTRSDERFARAEEAVDLEKRRHILRSTGAFMAFHRLDMPVRFDIITLVGKQPPFALRHIPDAFDGSDWTDEQSYEPRTVHMAAFQQEAVAPLPLERVCAKGVDSTNDVARCWLADRPSGAVLVTADFQLQGRGQGGSHWESEPGRNLLFSLGLRPDFVPANRQFGLLQAASLALLDTVAEALPPQDAAALSLKWPNDLYYKDMKLSGTLIENRLKGRMLATSVIGIGLNVNQAEFRSDAPNPVSLCQITGRELARDELLERFVEHFTIQYLKLQCGAEAELAGRYQAALYRREGWHKYEDQAGPFRAELAGVEPDGHLLLRDEEGTVRRYAFKEVRHII